MQSKIGKTSTIDVALSRSGKEGVAHFLDVKYENDNYGGNQNRIYLEFANTGGNPLELTYTVRNNGKDYQMLMENVGAVSIEIKGRLERSDFLAGLQMILDAEKMSELMDPGY